MKTKKGFLLVSVIVACVWISQAFSQGSSFEDYNRVDYDRIAQGDIINQKIDEAGEFYVKVHQITEQYPEATYSYVYDDSGRPNVRINGISNKKDKELLRNSLIGLKRLKDELAFKQNPKPETVLPYYVNLTQPEPKEGYINLYKDIKRDVVYPDEALEQGLEGTITAQFRIKEDGKIDSVITKENIDTEFDWIVKEMEKEVQLAVLRTSGKWKPAVAGQDPFSQWVTLPISFKLENNSPYYRSMLY